MAENLTMEVVNYHVTRDDFAISENDSDAENGKDMYAYQESPSAVWEAAESLALTSIKWDKC